MKIARSAGMIRGIVFDLDGTLVDSNAAHAESWQEALSEYGLDVPYREIRRSIGMGGDKLIPSVLRRSPIEGDREEGERIAERKGEIFRTKYLRLVRPFPRVKQLLERLRQEGFKTAIASSSRRIELELILQQGGLSDLVDFRVAGDTVQRTKPDPDPLLDAMELLDIPPSETLMIGDTPYDIEAARRAGAPVIAFKSGGWDDLSLSEADAVYRDPADLLENIEHSILMNTPLGGRFVEDRPSATM